LASGGKDVALDGDARRRYDRLMVATAPLQQAVETRHGGTAVFVRSVPVHHSRQGKTLWNGAVQVFDLVNSDDGAVRAYAWSQGSPDGARRCFVVADSEGATDPAAAVKAFLAGASD
jgi:hypothetical protein